MDPPVGCNDAQDNTQVGENAGDQPTKGTKRRTKVVKERKKAATNRPPTACWDHFDKIEAKDTDDGIQRATCKYCRMLTFSQDGRDACMWTKLASKLYPH